MSTCHRILPLPSLLLCSLYLASVPACSADATLNDLPPAVFSSAEPVALDTVFKQPRLSAHVMVWNYLTALDHADTGCPSMTETAGGVVLRGNGCTANGGLIYDGQMTYSERLRPDESVAEVEMVFRDFHHQDADGEQARTHDGRISITFEEDGARIYETDLRLTVHGYESESQHTIACTAAGVCTVLPGAWAAVVGVGRFDISGAFDKDLDYGTIQMVGAETLDIEYESISLEYQIDGSQAERAYTPWWDI